jgi:anti-anti-sigma factor
MTLVNVEISERDEVLVLTVAGEIDLSNADQLRADVIDAIGSDHDKVALDLTGTSYLDSTGVRLLFDLAARMQARRRHLALVVTDRAIVRRVIVLTKLDEAVPVHSSLDAALTALAELAAPPAAAGPSGLAGPD